MDIAQIKHIAELARLEFSEEELKKFAEQFNKIIEFVNKVSELPVDGLEPMITPLGENLVLRPDEPGETLPSEDALRNAPDNKEGLFGVPRVI